MAPAHHRVGLAREKLHPRPECTSYANQADTPTTPRRNPRRDSLRENKISQDLKSRQIRKPPNKNYEGSSNTSANRHWTTQHEYVLKKKVRHKERDEKRRGGGPTHKPPFGDLWSLMWHWRLSHVVVAGTTCGRRQRRDAAEGGDRMKTQLKPK
jgi:hypothetical protein